jgi:hypothetical protein
MTYKLINISKQCPEAIGTKFNKMSNSISSSMYHSNMKLGSLTAIALRHCIKPVVKVIVRYILLPPL